MSYKQFNQLFQQKKNESDIRSNLLDEQLRIDNVTEDYKQWVGQQSHIEKQLQSQIDNYNRMMEEYSN